MGKQKSRVIFIFFSSDLVWSCADQKALPTTLSNFESPTYDIKRYCTNVQLLARRTIKFFFIVQVYYLYLIFIDFQKLCGTFLSNPLIYDAVESPGFFLDNPG